MNNSRIGRMTAAERRAGRYMRAPDDHPMNDSGGGQNNPAGNSADSITVDDPQNNPGQTPDGSQFWNDPPADQNNPSDGNGDGDDSQAFGQQLNQSIQGMNFGDLFTQEIGAQIQEGDLSGVNARFEELGRNVVMQSVQQSIRVMQRFGQQLIAENQRQIEAALGGRDNVSELSQAFPAAMKDSASRPIVESVFAQAMKHTKNDRRAAIEMTRSMLKLVGKGGAEDLGVPNSNPDDFMGGGNLVNLDSLLGRS